MEGNSYKKEIIILEIKRRGKRVSQETQNHEGKRKQQIIFFFW